MFGDKINLTKEQSDAIIEGFRIYWYMYIDWIRDNIEEEHDNFESEPE